MFYIGCFKTGSLDEAFLSCVYTLTTKCEMSRIGHEEMPALVLGKEIAFVAAASGRAAPWITYL